MIDDADVKTAIYAHFAETGRRPAPVDVGTRVGASEADVVLAYGRLRAQRVLLLEAGDPTAIRMAPPFSGVPTQHVVESAGISYFANCAWDALGIPAALQRPSLVRSRCEQTLEPLVMEVGVDGPLPSDWVFHCEVPAARWWSDLVFT